MSITNILSDVGDFSMLQMKYIEAEGKMVKKFQLTLTQRQEDLLRLTGVQ